MDQKDNCFPPVIDGEEMDSRIIAGTGTWTRKKVKEIVRGLSFLDHWLFKALLTVNKGVVSALALSLFDLDVSIIEAESEVAFEMIGAKSVRPDVALKTTEGTISIDLQLENTDPLIDRMMHYAVVMESHLLKAGDEYGLRSGKTVTVVFFCNFDPFGKGQALYAFRMDAPDFYDTFHRRDRIFIAVNMPLAKTIKNPLGEFLCDLEKTDPREMQNSTLLHYACMLKLEEEGVDFMTAALKQLIDKEREYIYNSGLKEGEKRGFKEGEKRGFKEGEKRGLKKGEERGLNKGEANGIKKEAYNTVTRMAKKNKYSIEDIADASNLPDSEVKKIIASMQ